jgi:YegS/Rv2252/BmrU family lipid kinase
VTRAGLGSGAAAAVVIINPASGPARRGGPAERVAIATRVLERARLPYRVQLTERPNHAYDLAGAAVEEGARLVIAWGGDGTINEVAQALVFTGASLGLVPGGSGNGLARELKVPFDPERAIERALAPSERRLDVGEISGRMFFNVAGIGLDAKVAFDVAAFRNPRGLRPYVVASARELLSYFPCQYAIDSDAGSLRASALVVAVANSRQYGYAALVAPLAVMDDGLLDVVVVEARSFVGNVVRLPSLFTGGFHKRSGVTTLKVREVRVRANTRMLFHVDGEVIEGERELVARVHAGALRVRA